MLLRRCGVLLYVFAFSAYAGSGRSPQRTALVDVAVVDVDRQGLLALSRHQTVVVTDGIISARGPTSSVHVPRGAVVVAGRGKYLIPGLCDMHVHTLPNERRPQSVDTWLPVFVVNGVTTVRDMGGAQDALNSTRSRIARERLTAPRIVAAGPAIDGVPPHFGVGVANEAEAREQVRVHNRDGADFIKPYDLLTREAYFALVDEAKKLGMPVAGHVPVSLSVKEVSDAGQASVEHLLDFAASCATNEDELRDARRTVEAARETKNFATWVRGRWAEEEHAAQTHSRERCVALFHHLATNGTWITPTLVNKRAALDVKRRLNDSRMQYVEPSTRVAWDRNAALSPSTAEEVAGRTKRFDLMLRLVSEANDASALLLAGTDVGSPFPLLPGFSLHEELQILVEAGLTPLQALRAATLGPARYFHEERTAGTVAVGKTADLVLLERNPLEDIRNTQAIVGVMAQGRWYTAADRAKILATVKSLSTRPSRSE